MLLKLFNKFKQGDLVFGLLEPREEVINKLRNEGYTHTIANKLNDPAVKLVMNKTIHRIAKTQLDSRQYKHYCFLRKNKQYLARQPGRPVPLMTSQPQLGAAYRRACKLLLTNRDPKRKYKAHIIVKDIDLQRVCDKTKSGLGVTDSEIRAAFRDELRHGRNPQVFFYNPALELLAIPPWEQLENKAIFEPYREHVLKKDEDQKEGMGFYA